jgi:hypothetical protein
MRIFLSCLQLLLFTAVFSQENIPLQDTLITKVDSLYREDQFYFGITYNIATDGPSGLSQNKFSSGLSGGFLRDMPINKKRTVAIAAGIGFTYNNYNQNIVVSTPNEIPVYTLIDPNSEFNKNKFSLLTVDVPIEFRWRTSTYESHKFWRIYSGVKFSYLLYDKSIFDGAQGKIVVTGNNDFNKLQYGAYVSAGYNTINVYAYYGLNSLFKSAKIQDESIVMKALNIGVIFYIL